MSQSPQFLYTTCQVGAEQALKREFARRWPECHLAFSRPGFVTFKVVGPTRSVSEGATAAGAPPHLAHGYDPIFARACGHVLGKVDAQDLLSAGGAPDYSVMVRQVWQIAGERPYAGLHVWHRDVQPPGEHDYEPGPTPQDKELAGCLRAARPDLALPAYVHPGRTVLDVVVVEEGLWWVGWHTASAAHTCWPGGFAKIVLPEHAVARTYLKMEEALRWSEFPMRPGQHCAELGSAPGGASQALLARGLIVTGIDPAEIHPTVLANPNFRHIRKRGHEVRRREFRKIKWLTADMNVPPSYTLDTVEGIVTHPQVRVRGLLLTLKLPQWELADQIPEYLFRIRTWGFHQIRARQLHHNRREFTVAALRT